MGGPLMRVSVTVPPAEAERARAIMLELFPEGFEERTGADGVELAAYTDSAARNGCGPPSAVHARPRSRRGGRTAGGRFTSRSGSGRSGSGRPGRRQTTAPSRS